MKLTALVCAFAMVAIATTAEARPRKHSHGWRAHHAHVVKHKRKRHAVRHVRQQDHSFGFDDRYQARHNGGGDLSGLVSTARRYVGATAGQLGLPGSLWCADFMNMVARQVGLSGTGSRLAKSYLKYPKVPPRVGAIAVMSREGGGHVGVVSGFDKDGDPIIISGNSTGGRVAESTYSKHRGIIFVSPRG